MKKAKLKYGEDYDKHEFNVNIVASFLAGAIGSGVTNGLDVLTITKQANPESKLQGIIKSEGLKLLTKGLGARVFYNSMQSVAFFNLVLLIGKVYNVDICDE